MKKRLGIIAGILGIVLAVIGLSLIHIYRSEWANREKFYWNWLISLQASMSVSYTHLDVYKRQLHDCGKRMDVIFAVTLFLFSIGMNSPKGKQIKEGLQMLRGYIF